MSVQDTFQDQIQQDVCKQHQAQFAPGCKERGWKWHASSFSPRLQNPATPLEPPSRQWRCHPCSTSLAGRHWSCLSCTGCTCQNSPSKVSRVIGRPLAACTNKSQRCQLCQHKRHLRVCTRRHVYVFNKHLLSTAASSNPPPCWHGTNPTLCQTSRPKQHAANSPGGPSHSMFNAHTNRCPSSTPAPH